MMKLSLSFSEVLLAVVVVSGIGIAAWRALGGTDDRAVAPSVSVKVPTLSAQAAAGKTAFDGNCAQCHGKDASGTDHGPPLVHDIYNPGHHTDEAFHRAVRQGVVQHHWPFGNMAALPNVTAAQVAEIVRYVRELQLANGIVYRPHQM